MTTNISETNGKHSLLYESVARVYFPQVPRIQDECEQGNYGSAAVRATQLAVQAPFTVGMVKDSFNTLKNPSKIKLFQSVAYNQNGKKITNWQFIPDSFKGKLAQSKYFKSLVPLVDKFDRSVAKTNVGDKILKIVDKNSGFINNNGSFLVNGNKAAVATGEILAKIPLLGLAFSGLLELPKILRAAKHGDGMDQLGRSTLNIAGGTLGCATLATLTTCLIPPFGGFIGAALGAYIGGKISEKIGYKIFGKPKDKHSFKFAQSIYSKNS